MQESAARATGPLAGLKVLDFTALLQGPLATQILADLGVRKMDELIGRVDLLELQDGVTKRQSRLDLSPIISNASFNAIGKVRIG